KTIVQCSTALCDGLDHTSANKSFLGFANFQRHFLGMLPCF
ncbi:unnamed protein product, partial [Adineta ricciae]